MTYRDHLIKITRQLYPTGRAWRMPLDGYLHGLHKALGISEAEVYGDAESVITDSLIPDNDDFTAADATDWERRLGLSSDPSTALSVRKAAILRKMASPGSIRPKGHYLYLEKQLQDAGFDVYVHENLLPTYPNDYYSVAPNLHYGNTNFIVLRCGTFQLGQRQLGRYWNNKIVNHYNQETDNNFYIGDSLAATFFIGGQNLGTYANVASARETEFRQLILSQKQVQAVGFLFINYT